MTVFGIRVPAVFSLLLWAAAWEVVDTLGSAPAVHALPVGNAGNITAYWMGYKQYDKGLPRIAQKVGEEGVELALKVIAGEEVPDFTPIDGVLITQENVDKFLAPDEGEEAAMDLYATRWKTFRHVTLPQLFCTFPQ